MRDSKGKEYAHDENRFANFDRLAKELNLDRKKILWVYLTKHLDSIISFINESKEFSSEPINGRVRDAILYLALLDGMIAEEKQASLRLSRAEKLNPTLGEIERHNLPPKMNDRLCSYCGYKFSNSIHWDSLHINYHTIS